MGKMFHLQLKIVGLNPDHVIDRYGGKTDSTLAFTFNKGRKKSIFLYLIDVRLHYKSTLQELKMNT